MQDEVTKHTRKIYQTMKNQDLGFWKKIREVVVEIFIIVFAVTLSIWLHNWSDQRKEQQQAIDFLIGIKADLQKDIDSLEGNRKTFFDEVSYFHFLKDIVQTKAVDTTSEAEIAGHFYFQMRVTHFNIARYEGFKSSGKLGTIDNDSLRQAILKYYQQTVASVGDAEEIANSFQNRLMEAQISMPENESYREFAKSKKVRILLEFTLENLPQAAGEYAHAEQQARQIIKAIDLYLHERQS